MQGGLKWERGAEPPPHFNHCVLNVVDGVERGSGVTDSHEAYTENLDKLAVYVASRQTDLRRSADAIQCGFVTRLNNALFKPQLHVQCSRVLRGRYVLIEALGVSDRWSRLFTAVLCEVMVYQ